MQISDESPIVRHTCKKQVKKSRFKHLQRLLLMVSTYSKIISLDRSEYLDNKVPSGIMNSSY